MAIFTFPHKDPGETVVVTFDFAADLTTSETLISAVFTCVQTISCPGHETPAASLITGSSIIVGSQARQAITDGTSGFDYDIICTATTSAGQVFVETARLPIRWTR